MRIVIPPTKRVCWCVLQAVVTGLTIYSYLQPLSLAGSGAVPCEAPFQYPLEPNS